jgi:hypothetical protein
LHHRIYIGKNERFADAGTAEQGEQAEPASDSQKPKINLV